MFELNTITFDPEAIKPNEEKFTLFHAVIPMTGDEAMELKYRLESTMHIFFEQNNINKSPHIAVSAMK